MTRRMFTAVGSGILLACAAQLIAAPRDEKPPEKPDGARQPSIKTIMLQAHLTPQNRSTSNNLDNKVLDDKATEDERKELLELYKALGKQKPPRGKNEEWIKRTDELVASLKAVYAGEKDAKERFIQARDCKACHSEHRAPQ